MTSSYETTIHIFDCDGVIADSNTLKIESFKSVLISRALPQAFVDICVAEFASNFGRGRSEHFRECYRLADYGGVVLREDDFDCMVAEYGASVESIYEEVRLIAENCRYIMSIASDCKFLVSGSDQNQLRRYVPSFNLGFKVENIFGGPEPKEVHISSIIEKFTNAKRFVFYGDATRDAEAAVNCGVEFVGLLGHSADRAGLLRTCDKLQLKVAEDLREVFREA